MSVRNGTKLHGVSWTNEHNKHTEFFFATCSLQGCLFYNRTTRRYHQSAHCQSSRVETCTSTIESTGGTPAHQLCCQAAFAQVELLRECSKLKIVNKHFLASSCWGPSAASASTSGSSTFPRPIRVKKTRYGRNSFILDKALSSTTFIQKHCKELQTTPFRTAPSLRRKPC